MRDSGEKFQRKDLKQNFRQRVDLFVFFHLGSDASVAMREGAEGVRVHIQHRRVEPFDLSLSEDQIQHFLDHPREFEQFMVEHLNLHRRS